MKKKKIAEIPFKRPKRMKNDEWYAEAQMIDIDDVTYLFLDVWFDKEPYYRYVANKKEYGHYYPATKDRKEIWDGAKLQGEAMREPFKITPQCDKVAAEFAKKEKLYNRDFESVAEEIEIECLRTAQVNAALRRRFKLQQREDSLKALPDDWDEYIKEILHEHRLYYHRHGRFTDYKCSCCGAEYTVANKSLDSYEGRFEYTEPAPKNNQTGKCLHCGCTATQKPIGKEQNGIMVTRCIYLAQHTKEDGFVVRYFEAWKKLAPGEEEKTGWTEATRTYIRDGKLQRDFNKYDCYLGNNYWDDCNLAGLSNIRMYSGAIHPSSWDVIDDSFMKYVPVKKLIEMSGRCNLAEIATIALKWPQIEMLDKLGYEWALRKIMESSGWTSEFDSKAKKPWDFFKVKKNRLQELQHSGERLKALQLERECNETWNDVILGVVGLIQRETLLTLRSYMSTEKAINRVFDYCNLKKDKILGLYDKQKIQRVAGLYADYLVMRDTQGFDMTNSVYLHPRNLQASHDEMVRKQTEERDAKYLKEKEAKYNKIPKIYRKANRHFRYQEGELIIRPARSATEIILEGRLQHHCVGGDTYLGRHNKGETFILFLRFAKDKKTPYYTIEMDWDYNVKQFYAAHDKQPNREEIQTWLKEYADHMKAEQMQQYEEVAQVG